MKKTQKLQKAKVLPLLVLCTMVTALLPFGAAPVHGAVLEDNTVYNITQGTDYPSIQEAIDAADPGDELVAGPGTYNEAVDVDLEGLSLTASEGAGATTIQSPATGIHVGANQFSLDGFTIQPDPSDVGVYVSPLVDGNLAISNCNFIQSHIGIVVNKSDASTAISITDNTFDIDYVSVFFEEMNMDDTIGGNVTLSGNDVSNSDGGFIFTSWPSDASVLIQDNTFSDNAWNSVYFSGISDSYVQVTGNTFLGGNEDGGVQVYNFSGDPSGQPMLQVQENIFDSCEIGINVGTLQLGEFTIQDNILMDCGFGVYAQGFGMESNAQLDITGNIIEADSTGIEFYYGICIVNAESKTLISKNMISGSQSGSYISGILLCAVGTSGDPADVVISGNDLTGNQTGVMVGLLASPSASSLKINGNNISGNTTAGLEYTGMMPELPVPEMDDAPALANDSQSKWDTNTKTPTSLTGTSALGAPIPQGMPVLNALWNWWGAADGPQALDNDGSGDPITAESNTVDYNPWIAKLVLDPESSKAYVGNTQTFTATLLDSSGMPADVDALVYFAVDGVHSLGDILSLDDGSAAFTYTGEKTGTDAVYAGLSFSGAYPLDALTSQADTEWVPASGVSGDDTSPDTGDSGPALWMLFAAMMAAAVAGAAVHSKRHN